MFHAPRLFIGFRVPLFDYADDTPRRPGPNRGRPASVSSTIRRTTPKKRLMSQIRLFRKFGSSLRMSPADEDYQIRRKSPLGLRRSIKTGRKRIRSAPDRSINQLTAIGGLIGTDSERISVWRGSEMR